jgi:putative drug exporter of the RND superfamily
VSSLLYRMGRMAYRRHWLVVGAWVVILLALGSLMLAVQRGTDDTFRLPGSQSQSALDQLGRVFPQVSGTFAQLVVVMPPGQRADTGRVRASVASSVDQQAHVDQVAAVVSPFDSIVHGAVSKDGRAAVVVDQLTVNPAHVRPATRQALRAEGERLRGNLGPGARVYVGGDAFSNRVPQPGTTELAGLVIALVVLLVFLRSFAAAMMPLITAVTGVGTALALIYAATRVLTVTATAPMLAMMIGLAVGIDYALFVIARHRDQLAQGLDPQESAARTTATAGSAVVFAAGTVIIALLGLIVAGIPFLTLMGVAAAMAVAIAAAVVLTLMPALFGVLGARLRPRTPTRRGLARRGPTRRGPARERRSFSAWWVRLVTARPLVTILLVIAGVGLLAAPAGNLRLSLPDAGSEPKGHQARDTYDVVAQYFGPGYNGPLIITADILSSHTPVQDMNRLRTRLQQVPGVASVSVSTPDPKGDTGIVQIVPTQGPASPATADLVTRLRALLPQLQQEFGMRDMAVTGITAVQVDVSNRLGAVLLPFGLLVVGLSLVLLVLVFRSIAVPIKATAGYVLSVAAAFGATTWVFVEGHGASLLDVTQTGSVISFLPIILMGVLFGLAMDYEVFLVSRMAEEHAHGAAPRQAIQAGFGQSAPVVFAAAAIMLGVFVSFIPEGGATIKPIAFGLTVGVFVDAFAVRMTFVPAVLALLDRHAWWMPARWRRSLPHLDVEGAGLSRALRLTDWPAPDSREVVSTRGLTAHDTSGRPAFRPLDLHLEPGQVAILHGIEGTGRTAILYALGGRLTLIEGDAKIAGLVLPDRAHHVRLRTALIACRWDPHPVRAVEDALRHRLPLVLVDDLDQITGITARQRLRDLFATQLPAGHTGVVITAADAALVLDLLPDGCQPVVVELRVPRSPHVHPGIAPVLEPGRPAAPDDVDRPQPDTASEAIT